MIWKENNLWLSMYCLALVALSDGDDNIFGEETFSFPSQRFSWWCISPQTTMMISIVQNSPKTQRYSVYYHVWQGKALNLQLFQKLETANIWHFCFAKAKSSTRLFPAHWLIDKSTDRCNSLCKNQNEHRFTRFSLKIFIRI